MLDELHVYGSYNSIKSEYPLSDFVYLVTFKYISGKPLEVYIPSHYRDRLEQLLGYDEMFILVFDNGEIMSVNPQRCANVLLEEKDIVNG